jgi:dopachrome tautomerase
MDLATNQQIRRFVIPDSSGARSAGLASITVDVAPGKCNDAFAYVPDLAANRLHVYSFRDNRMWTFQHNYFHLDPLQGDFDVAGQRYQWDDGIFSVMLSQRNAEGFRFAYFHPMVSISEFAVSTRTLQNETAASQPSHLQGFIHIGNRGANKQSTMHDFDPVTGVIFYAEVGRNAVGCFNTARTEFNAANHGTVAQDNVTMIYPSDLQVSDGMVYVMTNRLPIFVYSSFDAQDYNFRLWRQDTRKAVAGTVCQ